MVENIAANDVLKNNIGNASNKHPLNSHFLPLTQTYIEPEKNNFLSEVNKSIDTNLTSSLKTIYSLSPYQIKFYFNQSISDLENKQQEELASCFCTIFNNSWKENWTLSSAIKSLKKISSPEDGIPIIGVLYHNHTIVGFIVCKLKSISNINTKDFPYSLPSNKKKESVNRTKHFYQNILNAESVLVIQEIGIAPHNEKSLYSKLLSPYLCYPAIKYAHNYKTPAMLFWTNTSSQAFNWGISIQWVPFHFYLNNDLVLFQGSTRAFIESAYKLFPETIRTYSKELQKNKRNYLCKI